MCKEKKSILKFTLAIFLPEVRQRLCLELGPPLPIFFCQICAQRLDRRAIYFGMIRRRGTETNHAKMALHEVKLCLLGVSYGPWGGYSTTWVQLLTYRVVSSVFRRRAASERHALLTDS